MTRSPAFGVGMIRPLGEPVRDGGGEVSHTPEIFYLLLVTEEASHLVWRGSVI